MQKDYYLNGIKNNDYKIIEEIYTEFSPSIVRLIKKTGGSEEDARDVFQDAMIVIFKKVKDDQFELTSTFKTFLYGVSNNVWKKIKSKRKINIPIDEHTNLRQDYNSIDVDFEQLERVKFLNKKMNSLSKECRTLLFMSFNKISGKEIAEQMGYSYEYVKRKKYKCKKELIESIKADVNYSEYL